MADFDPYYQWLAIPPKDQPPNHYRLLGVELFESNAEAIANAADQRMVYVRSFQSGKYADLSQRLLNEIATAKVCLLNTEKKAAYDRRLREQAAAPHASPPPFPPPALPASQTSRPDLAIAPPPRGYPAGTVMPTAKAKRWFRTERVWLGLGVLVGAALALAIVLVVKSVTGGKNPSDKIAGRTSEPVPNDGDGPGHPSDKMGRTGPPETTPETAVKPKPIPSASQGTTRGGGVPPAQVIPAQAAGTAAPQSSPRGTNPQKPAEAAPSTATTTPPRPAGSALAAVGESKEPSSKELSPAGVKPKPAESLERPKENSGVAGTAAPAKEKTPDEAAVAPAKEKTPQPVVFVPPAEKLAVPTEAAQKQALAIIREKYKAGGHRSTDKAALALKLVEKADESRGDPTARFALLQEAKKLAVEAGQVELPFEIIDVMASEFRISAAEMKAEVLVQATKSIHSLDDRKALAVAALENMDEAIAADNFETARKLGKQANQMALPLKNRDFIQAIAAKNKEVETAAKLCADAKAATAVLTTDPGDADANATMGKYLCTFKGDWDRGVPMLARGSNAALRALAERDVQGATTAAAQVELGDAWWAVHGKDRAAYWYEKAMPRLKTPERDKVTERIKNEPFGRRVVDLLAWIDPDRDDADGNWGKWTRNGSDVVCTSFPPLTDDRQDHWSTLALPVEVNGQYDFLISFTRNKVGAPQRDEILIDFPVGSHCCAFAVGESGCGLGNIDGKNCYQNSTTTDMAKLVDGRQYALLLKVRRMGGRATIDVLLESKPLTHWETLIHWQGAEISLGSVNPYIQQDPPLPQRFFLSTRSLATFRSARLRLVSGKARWAM